jgi:hypothetical protein
MTTTYITDSVGNLVADGNAQFLTSFNETSHFQLSDIELAKMLFDRKMDIIFALGYPYSFHYMVGIKDHRLYAIEMMLSEGLKVYTWEEFMECCFDEWFCDAD